jgi:hypothetical protein
MSDIVPELEAILSETFANLCMTDSKLKRLQRTMTAEGASLYAARLGELAGKAIQSTLTEDVLPDGRLYYNIVERLVMPMMERNFGSITEQSTIVQQVLDEAEGIGIKPIAPKFNSERFENIIGAASSDQLTYAEGIKFLGEPIVNASQCIYDDFIDENARFRQSAGLKCTIIRIPESGCCEWCRDMSGAYEYGTEPKDIYRRHDRCRCTVTFKSEKYSQNVWTRRTWTGEDKIAEREMVGRELVGRLTSAERRARRIELNERVRSGQGR